MLDLRAETDAVASVSPPVSGRPDTAAARSRYWGRGILAANYG